MTKTNDLLPMQWTMTNDKRSMINDWWLMTDDWWPMTNDQWPMTNDQWPMTDNQWPISITKKTNGQINDQDWGPMIPSTWNLTSQLTELDSDNLHLVFVWCPNMQGRHSIVFYLTNLTRMMHVLQSLLCFHILHNYLLLQKYHRTTATNIKVQGD